MKVINQGNKNFHKWWYGKRIKCEFCDKEVELEMGDEKNASTVKFNDAFFEFVCTNCYAHINIYNNKVIPEMCDETRIS